MKFPSFEHKYPSGNERVAVIKYYFKNSRLKFTEVDKFGTFSN